MNKLAKSLIALSLGITLTNVAIARDENIYYDMNNWVLAEKYFDIKEVEIYEIPLDHRSNTWYATPMYVMSVNKKTKKPDLIQFYVEERGYSGVFQDAVVIDCTYPNKSFIDRGDNGRISLKDSMAINSTPWDDNYKDHIARGAVNALFKRYCKEPIPDSV